MYKRIIIFLLALMYFITNTNAQTSVVTPVKKHDSTIVATVVNFKVEMPKSNKAEFISFENAKVVLSKLQRNDSIITDNIVELNKKVGSYNNCNSPPDKLNIQYYKIAARIGIAGISTLLVVICIVIWSTESLYVKLGIVGITLLLILTLFFLTPPVVLHFQGYLSDS